MHSNSKNTALAFLLGALLMGGALGFSVERYVLSPNRHASRNPETYREQLARQLDMSQEQRARFDSILARRDARIDTLMAPVRVQMDSLRPQYRAIRDEARTQIRALLSSEQQKDFDRFIGELTAEEARKDTAQGRLAPRPGATPAGN